MRCSLVSGRQHCEDLAAANLLGSINQACVNALVGRSHRRAAVAAFLQDGNGFEVDAPKGKPKLVRYPGEPDGPRPKPERHHDRLEVLKHGPDQDPSHEGYINSAPRNFPPPPRIIGNLGLPEGAAKDLMTYAKARYAETERANDAWSDAQDEHDEVMKHDIGEYRRKPGSDELSAENLEVGPRPLSIEESAARVADEDAKFPDRLYTSPNNDNGWPQRRE
eukprot:TRINITY_DN74182_c0_g1_i1.p1 TRINITY_DN74182_c0_g1~~TRINITY_DN74182_c0_g1_i1.p1  ORF type:complete len:221 (+),score=37.25 TRINITY_DN74182_c0_g1_i1:75-737(+)